MRLLVFNCHEAWVYQLGVLDYALDIIVGLEGHHVEGWDARMRPLPAGARTLTLAEALSATDGYDCIVCHNLTDLLDCKGLAGPRLLVMHSTLEGRKQSEGAQVPLDQLRATIRKYLDLVGGHAVAISDMKRGPDGFPADVVRAGVDVDDYSEHTGTTAAGLRVANQISLKRDVLMWEFHAEALDGLPVTLVGHNPDMPGVEPARSWDDLKRLLSEHRFFIHTADPRYEDGYNMASLEAMAAGLPVIGNRHPTSPIEHGVSGFLADDPAGLRRHAQRLLDDPALARDLGAAAREAVARDFPLTRFGAGMTQAITRAQATWREAQARRAGA